MVEDQKTDRVFLGLVFVLGLMSASLIAAYHNVADNDLWAKLSLGAFVWEGGTVLDHDVFAFTPVLPKYMDHEWGAGVLFYGLLRAFGPASLMLLKIALFCWTLLFAVCIGRRTAQWPAVLLLAIPGTVCLLPGYVPVIRSHALTYFFFAVTLWALDSIARQEPRPTRSAAALLIISTMLVWTNTHGGFVAGLGTIGVYTFFAIVEQRNVRLMLGLLIASVLVTFINPYGPTFWRYLLPALLHKRPLITEWGPLPLFGMDAFIGFRILFVIVIVSLAGGWARISNGSRAALVMLVLTCYLGWSSRRHAPFFAITAMAFAAPYLGTLLNRLGSVARIRLRPLAASAVVYCAVAVFVFMRFSAGASLQVLAPVRTYPVREVDILKLAGVHGNAAVPFAWGSYVSWRLHPNVKVSMDGRYEAAYPESTFLMNECFYRKQGADWDALVRKPAVDFVILDMALSSLRPDDLAKHGFEVIWLDRGYSALLARGPRVAALRKTAKDLPPTTIDPLDAQIAKSWWLPDAAHLLSNR